MQMTDCRTTFPTRAATFGPYGGVFVAETLIRALDELREQYAPLPHDPNSSPNSKTSSSTTSAGRRRSTTRGAGRKSWAARRSG
jgi:tryptophan synthase beta subunit